MEFVAFFQHLEEFDAGAADHWRKRVREEIRAAALTQHVDDLLTSGGESTDSAAEALAEGAGVDIDAAVEPEFLGDAVSGGTDHACGVAFVHHHEGVILLGEFTYPVHGGDVAVHAEHAVGDYDAEPLGLGFLQAAFQVGHVRICIAVADCLAEAHAVNDGCMVERI